MSETKPGVEGGVELLNSQRELKQLCDEIKSHKGEDNPMNLHTFWDVGVDPIKFEESLKSETFADVLPREGESLSIENGGDHYPDLGIKMGDVSPAAVSVRAWVWDYERHGGNGWACELDVMIDYVRDGQQVTVKLCASTAIDRGSTLPGIVTDLYSPAYADQGYEGHGKQQGRRFHDEDEAMRFISLARELYDKRIER